MTQTYPNPLDPGQPQEDREGFPAMGEPLAPTVENIHSSMRTDTYSIAQSGMSLFEQGPIRTLMGGVVIDLVSAPITPGEYRLQLSVAMGGVAIFLPHYVQFTLEGFSLAGGRHVHEGPGTWETMRRKLRHRVDLSQQPPDFALAPYNPERPVRIHFVTHIAMGGVEIYRL